MDRLPEIVGATMGLGRQRAADHSTYRRPSVEEYFMFRRRHQASF